MSKDPQFLELIFNAVAEGHQTRLGFEEQRVLLVSTIASQEEAEIRERTEAVLAAIPACIKSHFENGHPYGPVMRLRFDESSQDPRWKDEHWEMYKPDPNQLLKAAMQVFVYCQEHDLKPYLARDYDFDVQCFFLYICVDCRHHLP
jgi:hypothetical protein